MRYTKEQLNMMTDDDLDTVIKGGTVDMSKYESARIPNTSVETGDGAKARGDMGIAETAANMVEQTGQDASDSTAVNMLSNAGNAISGNLMPNVRKNALQTLARGYYEKSDGKRQYLDWSPEEQDYLLDKAFAGGFSGIARAAGSAVKGIFGGKAVGGNALMKEWEDGEGKKYEPNTPEWRAARLKYAQNLAKMQLGDTVATEQNAQTEAKNRASTTAANIVAKGLPNVAYTAAFLSPYGIALNTALNAAGKATGLATDAMAYDDNGNLVTTAKGDTAGKAWLKGGASALAETGVELAGGKIGGALVGRAMRPLSGAAGRAVGSTKVGQSVLRFGDRIGRMFERTSRTMHLENPFEENLEELMTAGFDALLGTDRRDAELKGTNAAGRLYEATREFFTPKNLLEMNEAMLLTMGAGAFVAAATDRGKYRQSRGTLAKGGETERQMVGNKVDDLILSHDLMTKDQLKDATTEEKTAALNAWVQGLSEDEVRQKIDAATGLVDRLANRIEGRNRFADNVTAIAGEMEKRHGKNRFSNLTETSPEAGGFDFTSVSGVNETDGSGNDVTAYVDPQSGVAVEEGEDGDGNRRYRVRDANGAYVRSTTGGTYMAEKEEASAVADKAAREQNIRVLERPEKEKFLRSEIGRIGIPGDYEIVGSMDELNRLVPGIENIKNYDASNPSVRIREGTMLADGTRTDRPFTVYVLDNIGTRDEATRKVVHEAGIHLMLDQAFESVADRAKFLNGIDRRAIKYGVDYVAKSYGKTVDEVLDDPKLREEALAHTAEAATSTPTMLGKMVHAFREMARGMGAEIPLNDEELGMALREMRGKMFGGQEIGAVQDGVNETLRKLYDQSETDKEIAAGFAENQDEGITGEEQPTGAGYDVNEFMAQHAADVKDAERAAKEEERAAREKERAEKQAKREKRSAEVIDAEARPNVPYEDQKKFDYSAKITVSDAPKAEGPTKKMPVYADMDYNGHAVKVGPAYRGGKEWGRLIELPNGNVIFAQGATSNRGALEQMKRTLDARLPKGKERNRNESANWGPADFVEWVHSTKKRNPHYEDLEEYRAYVEQQAKNAAEAKENAAKDKEHIKRQKDIEEAFKWGEYGFVKWVRDTKGREPTSRNFQSDIQEYEAFRANEEKSAMDAADEAAQEAEHKRIQEEVEDAFKNYAYATPSQIKARAESAMRLSEIRKKSSYETFLESHPGMYPALNFWLKHGKSMVDGSSAEVKEYLSRLSNADRKFLTGIKGGGPSWDNLVREFLNQDGTTQEHDNGDERDNDMTFEDVLNRALEERKKYLEWVDGGALSQQEKEEKDRLEQAEKERVAFEKENGSPQELFVDELEAREQSDKEYAEAKGFIENGFDETEEAKLSSDNLSKAQIGIDVIRIDHHAKTFAFAGWDAENGILTVFDMDKDAGEDGATIYYRVTGDVVQEAKGHGQRNETRAADNRADTQEEQGEGGGGKGGEGESVGSAKGTGADAGTASAEKLTALEAKAKEYEAEAEDWEKREYKPTDRTVVVNGETRRVDEINEERRKQKVAELRGKAETLRKKIADAVGGKTANTEKDAREGAQDAAYKAWLKKYGLKDAPARRKEFDGNQSAKPSTAMDAKAANKVLGMDAALPDKQLRFKMNAWLSHANELADFAKKAEAARVILEYRATKGKEDAHATEVGVRLNESSFGRRRVDNVINKPVEIKNPNTEDEKNNSPYPKSGKVAEEVDRVISAINSAKTVQELNAAYAGFKYKDVDFVDDYHFVDHDAVNNAMVKRLDKIVGNTERTSTLPLADENTTDANGNVPTDAGFAAWAVERDGKTPIKYASEEERARAREVFDMMVRMGMVDGATGKSDVAWSKAAKRDVTGDEYDGNLPPTDETMLHLQGYVDDKSKNKGSLYENAIRWRKALGTVDEALDGFRKDKFENGETDKHGMETLHVIREGDRVLKFRKPDNSTDGELDKVRMHNALFPDTAYTFRGFAKDKDGRAVPVLEQRYVEFVKGGGDRARRLLADELRKRFGNAELRGKEIHAGGWMIDDLKDANIGLDKRTGKPAVIDCIIHPLNDVDESLRWESDSNTMPKWSKASSEDQKGNGFEREAHPSNSPAQDGTPAASAKTIALKTIGSISQGVARVKQARSAMSNLLNEIDAKPISIDDFVSRVANRLRAKPVDARSRYRTYALDFATEDGQTFTLRLSDHSAHASAFVNNGSNGDFNISIVINNLGEDTALRNKHDDVILAQYTYAKEDFKNPEDVRKLIESVKGLFDNGKYVDLTGKAVVDTSGSRQLTETEHRDVAYAETVERGDRETAQRMVREAAAKAMPNTKVVDENGLPMVVYHGTDKHGFTVFDISKASHDNFGFHFGTEAAAKMFAKGEMPGVYPVFLNIKNPFMCDDIFGNSQDWFEQYAIEELENVSGERAEEAMRMADELRAHTDYLEDVYRREDAGEETGYDAMDFSENRMKKVIDAFKWLGYDGVVYKNEAEDKGSTSWIAFDSNQIKSADPVTYDDAGNVIPLSERFNPQNDDIRWSKAAASNENGNDNSDADNFKRWFADSKIVNADGEPLVVYRGASYNPTRQPEGKGVVKPEAYFTADREYASRYGETEPYYLRIERPFDVRNPKDAAVLKSLLPNGYDFATGKSGALDWGEMASFDTEDIKALGYDGIVLDEGGDKQPDGGTKYRGVSFVPLYGGAQVKSATKNNGDYSESPDVRWSKAATESIPQDVRDELHGITQDRINYYRAKVGLPPLESKRRTLSEMEREGQGIFANRDLVNTIVDAVNKKPRSLSEEETIAIGLAHTEANQQYDVKMAEVNEAMLRNNKADAARLRTEADAILSRVDKIERALRDTGSVAGRVLNLRRIMINRDLTLAGLTGQCQALKGKKLTDAEKADIAEAYKAVRDAIAGKDGIVLRELTKRIRDAATSDVSAIVSEIKRLGRKSVPTDVDGKFKDAVKQLDSWNNVSGGVLTGMQGAKETLNGIISYHIANGIGEGHEGKAKYDAIMGATLATVKQHLSGVTMEELEQAFSGYGISRPMSLDELELSVRDMDLQAKRYRALADLLNKKLPKQTGGKRAPTSEEVKRLDAEIRDKVNELKLQNGLAPEEMQKLVEKRLKQLDERLSHYRAMLMTENFKTKDKRAPRIMTPEILAKEKDVAAALKKVEERKRHYKAINNPLNFKIGNNYASDIGSMFLAAPRVLRTMLDLSATGAQGAALFVSHPIEGAKALKKSIAAFYSSKKADEIQLAMDSDPDWQEFQKFGGHAYSVSDIALDAVPEEFRASDTSIKVFGKDFSLDKIPGVKASERSFGAFLNTMNLAMYKAMKNGGGWSDPAGPTDTQKRDLAEALNVASGYGYGREGKGFWDKVMSAAFWAPRYTVAGVKQAVGYEVWSPFIRGGKDERSFKDRAVASKQLAKEEVRRLTSMAAWTLLATLLFGKKDPEWIEEVLDPRSGHFGNVRIGNREVSFVGPMKQWLTFMSRMINGNMVKNGVEKESNRMESIGRLARGKMSPLFGLGWDLLSGEDYVGDKIEWKRWNSGKNAEGKKAIGGVPHMLESFGYPLSFSDITEAIKDDGIASAIIMSPFALTGFAKNAAPVNDYNLVTDSYKKLSGEYRKTAKDNPRAARQMMKDNPELRDVKRIDDLMKYVSTFERQAKKYEDAGKPVPSYLTRRIEEYKRRAIESVRKARK